MVLELNLKAYLRKDCVWKIVISVVVFSVHSILLQGVKRPHSVHD